MTEILIHVYVDFMRGDSRLPSCNFALSVYAMCTLSRYQFFMGRFIFKFFPLSKATTFRYDYAPRRISARPFDFPRMFDGEPLPMLQSSRSGEC